MGQTITTTLKFIRVPTDLSRPGWCQGGPNPWAPEPVRWTIVSRLDIAYWRYLGYRVTDIHTQRFLARLRGEAQGVLNQNYPAPRVSNFNYSGCTSRGYTERKKKFYTAALSSKTVGCTPRQSHKAQPLRVVNPTPLLGKHVHTNAIRFYPDPRKCTRRDINWAGLWTQLEMYNQAGQLGFTPS